MSAERPRLAQEIIIHRDLSENSFTFTIDGETFPWYVGTTITTELGNGQWPTITIIIPAEHISTDHVTRQAALD